MYIALQVKDQQEAERKKVTSQEIQQALQEQTKVISQKQLSVKHDLSQVEPAVIEAQNGKPTYSNLKLYLRRVQQHECWRALVVLVPIFT